MFYWRNILRRALRQERYYIKRAKHNPTSILIPHLDESVLRSVEEGTMGPRIHPGKNQPGLVAADEEMIDVIKKILKDSTIKILLKDARKYLNYISARQPPARKQEQVEKSAVCYWELYNKSKVDFNLLSKDELKIEEEKLKQKADALLARRTFAWEPINYTEYVGKQYLVERMMPEYAVLNRIFYEITKRCPNFRPHSLFDLASGVGTVSLVAKKYWEDTIQEYFNVDPSGEMNELAKLILTRGDTTEPAPMNVHYRQFLPSQVDRKYSITVCSYSLLEFPTSETRLQSLWKLWCRTEDFMILIERGNATGFQLILEARDFIVSAEKGSKSSKGAHVFSPCPHDFDCPLLKTWSKTCRFKAPYERLPIGRTRFILNEFYSYVVIRRGERPEDDDPQWPRVLRPPTKKKRRAVCHLCTKDGKLCSYMFRKLKHGPMFYSFGKTVKAGDRLPILFSECDLSDFESEDKDFAKEVTNAEELENFSDDESDRNNLHE